MTMTKIGQMPGNWNIWEGSEQFPQWEREIGPAVQRELKKLFPGGHVYLVGDEIHGPATLVFEASAYDDKRHVYRYQSDTPDRDEIPGFEVLDDPDWVYEMYQRASEAATDAAMKQVDA
jgi:hypothetical protein